jgi:lauroyl/myristoyl acyltransferase
MAPKRDLTDTPHVAQTACAPTRTPSTKGRFALDGIFWRRMAQFGARRAPAWFVRGAPPVVGVAIAIAAPVARRRIAQGLERARGPVSAGRCAIDVALTFANFASCLTELLSTGSRNGETAEAIVHGAPQLHAVLAARRGVILATAHTAGWEAIGPLLAHKLDLPVSVVMQRERDTSACELNDSRRRAGSGLNIVHIGDNPLGSLPLLRQLRDGGVVAMQIDRVPIGMRARAVTLFGRPGRIPEGPLRLAQLSGAPIVSVFSTRTGHRRYAVYVRQPVTLLRDAGEREITAAAQHLADGLGEFVSAHPTQWFPFDG